MNAILKVSLLMLVLCHVISCGGKGEVSNSKFKIFGAAISSSGGPDFPGGILIAGRSLDNTQSFITPYVYNLELALKKGPWEFAVIGWTGSNSPMEGSQKCDHQVIDLKDDNSTIRFSTSTAKCLGVSTVDGKKFTDPRYYNNGFKSLQVRTCGNYSITACSGSTQVAPDFFNVEIPSSFEGIPTPAGALPRLISNCVAGAVSNITLPYGGGNGFVGTRVTTYKAGVALYNSPSATALDSFGNVYVADMENGLIRKISQTGVSSTIAGNPYVAYQDSVGVGIDANFYSPGGIAISNDGSALYVSDTGNNKIKKISLLPADYGTVSLFAGAGLITTLDSPRGLTFDPSGNLYIAEFNSGNIVKISTGNTPSIIASSQSFPDSVAWYNGKVYFTSTVDNKVLSVDDSGGSVLTLAGSATAGSADGVGASASFSGPRGIVADGSGNLYVADTGSLSIRKIVIGSGTVYTVASGLNDPMGISFISGKLFVTETGENKIKKIEIQNSYALSTYSGQSAPGSSDGAAEPTPCTTGAKHYYFEHGLGNELNTSIDVGGYDYTRRGVLSIQTSTYGGDPLSDPLYQGLFVGDYFASYSTLPYCGSPAIGYGYFYTNSTTSTVDPYPAFGDYIYCNGSSWEKFTPGTSVKLILQN